MREQRNKQVANAPEPGQASLNPFELTDEYASVDRARMLLKIIPAALAGSYIAAGVTAWMRQGYGIARPMPAEKLQAWIRDFTLPIHPGVHDFETLIGALAYLWRQEQSVDHVHISEAECPLGRFLRDQGLEQSEAYAWHAMIHLGGPGARPATQQLIGWAVRKIQEEGLMPKLADAGQPAPPRAAISA